MDNKYIKNKPIISIVVPCYNEEKNIEYFLKELIPILKDVNKTYEIIFINDGSKDNTLNILKEMKNSYTNLRVLNLSRNFGKEAALTAGIEYAKGDVVIPIDADLQHPPLLIPKFIQKWEYEGYDVVVGKRVSRTGESWLKKLSAKYFYKLHNIISDIVIPRDIGDYRLITRKVVNAISLLPENQRFMKGIFAWVGFETATVEYYQEERAEGESSFSGWKLWNFALDGITSFSTLPLRVWLYIGTIIAFFSFILLIIIIIEILMYGIEVPGYASTIIMTLFLGGIQLMGIGILGEYIGRIYKEAKRRPIYIIENEY